MAARLPVTNGSVSARARPVLFLALFAALAATHGALVLLRPPLLAPAVAATVYGPLLAAQALGLPVFSSAGSGGWASPSLLGWTFVVLCWTLVWGAAAAAGARLLRRRTSDG